MSGLVRTGAEGWGRTARARNLISKLAGAINAWLTFSEKTGLETVSSNVVSQAGKVAKVVNKAVMAYAVLVIYRSLSSYVHERVPGFPEARNHPAAIADILRTLWRSTVRRKRLVMAPTPNPGHDGVDNRGSPQWCALYVELTLGFLLRVYATCDTGACGARHINTRTMEEVFERLSEQMDQQQFDIEKTIALMRTVLPVSRMRWMFPMRIRREVTGYEPFHAVSPVCANCNDVDVVTQAYAKALHVQWAGIAAARGIDPATVLEWRNAWTEPFVARLLRARELEGDAVHAALWPACVKCGATFPFTFMVHTHARARTRPWWAVWRSPPPPPRHDVCLDCYMLQRQRGGLARATGVPARVGFGCAVPTCDVRARARLALRL